MFCHQWTIFKCVLNSNNYTLFFPSYVCVCFSLFMSACLLLMMSSCFPDAVTGDVNTLSDCIVMPTMMKISWRNVQSWASPFHPELCDARTGIWELWELQLHWRLLMETEAVASPLSSWGSARDETPNTPNAPGAAEKKGIMHNRHHRVLTTTSMMSLYIAYLQQLTLFITTKFKMHQKNHLIIWTSRFISREVMDQNTPCACVCGAMFWYLGRDQTSPHRNIGQVFMF